MGEGKREEKVWKTLERAVRTYGETLPIDAFLPPPESRIWHESEETGSRVPEPPPLDQRFDPPLDMEPGTPFAEEADFDSFDGLVDDIDIIDEELKDQLEG